MILLAAFSAVLARYTGQNDIIVGTPIANRNRREIENLIGFFANTLPLRAKLDGRMTYRQLLSHIKRVCLDAYSHQDLPFEKLVKDLNPGRELSRNPLFQVTFGLHPAPLSGIRLPAVVSSVVDWGQSEGVAKFDLSIMVTDSGRDLAVRLVYKTDLFEAPFINRLLGHWKTVLEAMVEGPERRMWEAPPLSRAEQGRLLAWNDTGVNYSERRWIHQLFAEQAELRPDSVAIVYEDRQVSYGELDHRANQLARHLRKLGVGPEMRVGICVERSVEMVVGLLGVLKAGGAYVPLDPEYPAERLAYMLAEAEPVALLTKEALINKIPEQTFEVVYLDTGWEEVAGNCWEAVDSGVQGENLAYVIYTSGSTGRPKGAMNTHQGIRNRLLWMQQEYGLEAGEDRVLQKTPFSFDVSVWEFFWPLMMGGCLVVARPGGHREGGYLAELMEQEQISTVHFVPSMLEVFLQEKGLERLRDLRRVICSGEALWAELRNQYYEQLKAGLHNLYGPTEAAVDVTYWRCEQQSSCSTVPIGRPIANTQLYVVDEWGQLAPVGVAGELYIGGAGVGRGYLKQPGLTAERFVPDPFGSGTGGRLYRTGDRVRWLEDGNLEFLGRLDQQVKIRGRRVELGEIEAVLGEQQGVRQSAVVVREEEGGRKRLVAYVVAEAEVELSGRQLREQLLARLPEHMAPTAYVFMPALPLTANGKLDRKALPAGEDGLERRNYVGPGTEGEEILCRIWGEVLRVERVGIQDNFFELGGDSILSVQIVARANQAGLRLTVRDMFQHQTIAALAEVAGRKPESLTHQLMENISETAALNTSLLSPDDFPLDHLSQEEFNSIINEVGVINSEIPVH
jgi:amino acid adenylation domain-containing protein